MKYMLLIHQGTAPVPGTDAWNDLSPEEQKGVAAEECRWAFYDTSRNRSRTWCSMEVCGNRAKTRRYRDRKVAG